MRSTSFESSRAATTAALAIAIAAALISIAGAGAQGPALPAATPAVDALVRDALEDRLSAGDLPDLQLVRGARVIAIRREMPSIGQSLGPAALPRRDGVEFVLTPIADLEAAARSKRERQAYLFVDHAAIDGDTAKLWMGADYVETLPAGAVKLCCCKAEGQFRLIGGRWRFVQWTAMTCS